MKKTPRFVCLVLTLILAGAMFWSRPAPAGDEWLPISQEDLALQDNPTSPGADAMILYRESAVDTKEAAFHEYTRIKIFTKEGTRRGDVELRFVKGYDEIENIRARTIHPDGRIINFEGNAFEKEIVKSSGLKFLAKTFTLADVQPGSIIEYRFRDQFDSKFIYNYTWNISNELFARYERFSIKPDSRSSFVGFMFRQYGLPAGLLPKQEQDGSFTLEVHDLKGVEEESFMPPENALRARVRFFYRSTEDPASETPEQFWNRMGRKWNEQVDHFIAKKGALESELGRTVSASDSSETKLQKIYARAQKIRNLNFEESKSKKETKQEELKPNSNVEDVLKRGYGNSQQINFLFIGLARAAGFEATEVRLTSRQSSFFLPQVKDAAQLDADVAWVRAGNQEYYLDPAAARYPFGLLPWFETSAKGIRISKDGGQVVETPLPTSSQATAMRRGDFGLDADGALSGKLQVEYRGQGAAIRRDENYSADETGRKKALEKEIQKSLISGAEFKLTNIAHWDDADQPLLVEGIVKMSGFGSAAGRRLLIPATIFLETTTKEFESSQRVNMVYFRYPYERTDELQFRVPEGYSVETLPAAQNVNPGVVSYQISVSQAAGTITVKRQLKVGAILLPVKAYPALRQFFATVKSDDEAQVVLQSAPRAGGN